MTTENCSEGWVRSDWYTKATDAELADSIAMNQNSIAVLQEDQGRAERELTHRLQSRNALELAHPTLEVKLVYPSPVYETAKLMALAELVPPEAFDAAYKSEWVKQVPQPARFDGRGLNVLARLYGKPVTDLLEKAKLPSSPRLVIKPREAAAEPIDQESDIRHVRP